MNGSKTVVRLGINLGENSFHLWGVNEQDEQVVKEPVRRSGLMRKVAKLPACLIGMEAWNGGVRGRPPLGTRVQPHGHEVRLMAPQFIKGYVKSNQNDHQDTEAIGDGGGACQHAFLDGQDG